MKKLCILALGLVLSAALTGCCCTPCCGGGPSYGCGYGGGGCSTGACGTGGGIPGAYYSPCGGSCAY